jgi:XRE family aerobic/anaerobic benzoate catabolism transcriptional regulator
VNSFVSSLSQLGARIRRARKEAGLTIAALAAESGLSARFLGAVERGRANISVRGLLQISEALGIPAAELLAAEGEDQESRSEVLRMLHDMDHSELELTLEFLRQRRPEPGRSLHFALVGLRGAGKTTIGRTVASSLDARFVELDREVEHAAGIAMGDIFAIHGEEYYRQLERECLVRLVAEPGPLILATGGSLVTSTESYSVLRRHFVTCWLKASAEDHWDRVLAQGDLRPISGHPSAKERLVELLEQRSPLYSLAHYVVDTTRLGLAGSIERVEGVARSLLREASRSPSS